MSCVVRPGRVGADVWKDRLAASEPFVGYGAASPWYRVAVVNTVSQRLSAFAPIHNDKSYVAFIRTLFTHYELSRFY